MFEKLTRWFFSGVSLVVHFAVVCLLFGIPVFFVVQANNSPEFSVNDITVEDASGDEYLEAVAKDSTGWYKISYDCSASAGSFSPYEYTIGAFGLRVPHAFRTAHRTLLTLDEPLCFTGSEADSFTLTLYVTASSAAEAKSIADTAGFEAKDTTRTFSFVSEVIVSNPPYFYPGSAGTIQ